MVARIQPIQNSFAGGVISPRMWGRSEIDGYQQALKESNNFVIYPQGPTDMRTGFQFRKRLAGASTKGRIIPFNYAKDEAYVLVITKDEIRVLSNDLSTDAGLATPYTSDAMIKDIQVGYPPGVDKMIVVCGEVAPQHITYGSPFTTGVQALTNAPAAWAGTVWPRAIGFGDGRSWFGNISTNPERYWSSKSGAFYDFNLGTATDIDAIDRTLDERGGIQWINKAQDLIFGTESGVYRITSEGGVITPGDIQAKLESAESSIFAQAAKASGSTLHISPDGRKLREFTYKFDTLSRQWTSKDLSFLVDHLSLNGQTLNRVAYQNSPDSIIWCPTDNGRFMGLTYDFQSEIYGWHPHTLGDPLANVVDMCTIRVNGTDQLWALVERNSGLEVVTLGTEYLDFYATQSSATEITNIGPFPHLADEDVTVLIDGSYGGGITLDSSGNGTVANAGKEFVVGINYGGSFESLDIDKGDEAGSARGLKKRWNKLFLMLHDSALPKINGTRPATRSPETPMGEVEPLATELVQVTTFDFTRGGNVSVVQDLPFKTTVLAFVGSLKQN